MASKHAKPTQEGLSGSNYVILMLLACLVAIGITAIISKGLIASAIKQTKVTQALLAAGTKLDKAIENAPKLVSSYNQVSEADRTKVMNSLPVRDDYPNLIALMERISQVSGVALTSIGRNATQDPAPVVAASGSADTNKSATTGTTGGASVTADPALKPAMPNPVTIDISVSGTQQQILTMIGNIEKSSRPMKITSMQISGSASSLVAQISITTYFQDEAKLPIGEKEIN